MKHRSTSLLAFVAGWMLMFVAPVAAQETPAPLLNLTADSLALQGYDAVAYLDENTAREGTAAHAAPYQGAVYYFASAANKNAFVANPERYLPQYGGWCAFGLGMDPQAYGYPQGQYPIDPKTFKIIDGKLYLFYNQDGFNALDHWNRDEKTVKERADGFWEALIEKR